MSRTNRINLLMSFLMLIASLNSCSEISPKDVIGRYEIDKTVIRNKSSTINDYNYIVINENQTFSLERTPNENAKIQGKWRVVNSDKNSTYIEFSYSRRIIKGELHGTIVYFQYPNDFHFGKYKSVLYVKKSG